MLAARDQENLVNAHQTTAAAKPLNQSTRALNPKTPSNLKTPFRASRNDENRPIEFKGQKTVLKDGPTKLDKNAFMTPLHQRERAPLGLKTTNAKTHAFKTPGPPQQSAKPGRTIIRPSSAKRSGRSKIVVAPAEPVHIDVLTEEEEDEPDYGYAPPPIKELPDPPIEFGYDETFPQFQGANMFKGYGEIYCRSPVDENGVSLRQKEEDEALKNFEEERMREASKPVHFPLLPTEEELDAEVDAMILTGPKGKTNESRLDTVKARSAASLLSEPDRKLPSVATRPTKASAQKTKPTSRASPSKPSDSTNCRAPPAMVSKNTIGFPKAKQAPSIIPKRDHMRQKKSAPAATTVHQSKIHPKDFVRLYGQPPVESNMWFRLKEFELLEEEMKEEQDELSQELFDTNFFSCGREYDDDDDEVFQLPMPE